MNRHSLIGCLMRMRARPPPSVWFVTLSTTPTASRRGSHTTRVSAAHLAKPDYDRKNIGGITVYGTFDFTRHWGVEGDIHYVSLFTPSPIGQDSLSSRAALRHSHHNRITG